MNPARAAFLLFLVMLFLSATAAVPRLLTVQGRLKEAGSAVSGNYDITFYIYNTESGGSPLYTEAHTGANAVPVSAGFFSVVLGEITPLDLPFKEQYWLALKVGSDAEMAPRIKLTNSSYAFVARDLNVASNLNIDSGTLYVDIANNRVGVGTTSPNQKLEVAGGNVKADRFGAGTGTVGNPSYFFSDDSDTGMYLVSTGKIGFATYGNDRVVIDGSGNVGIGTTSPAAKLDVDLSTSTNNSYGMRLDVTTVDDSAFDTIKGLGITTTINDSSDNVHSLYLYNEDTAANKAPGIFLYIDQEDPEATNATGIYFYELGTMTNAIDASDSDIVNALYLGSNNIRFSSSFNITDGSNNLFTFTDQGTTGDLTVTGNVGIGTTSPSYKLDVSGDMRVSSWLRTAQIRTSGAGTDLTIQADSGDIIFKPDASESVRFTSSGNVGIGTTSPGAKLEVNGQVLIAGKYPISGSGATINYTAPDGTQYSLDTSTCAADAWCCTADWGICFYKYSSGGDSKVQFTLKDSHSIACTFLHNEDDSPRPGFYFATDSGNGCYGDYSCFILRREGDSGQIIANYASYYILCF